MNKTFLFIELAILYLLIIALLHTLLGKEAFLMNLQPNIYLIAYIALILYSGTLALALGITEYFVAHLLLYRTSPETRDIYTLIVFGALSLFLYLLNNKNITLLQETNDYLQEKMDEFLRNFYLLKVAYEQTFKSYMINMSIRDILGELKSKCIETLQKGDNNFGSSYQMLASILFNEFNVRSFAIYNKNPKGDYEKVFSTDNYHELPTPIWKDILEKLRFSSIIKAADIDLETAGFLACVPVVDRNGSPNMFLIIQQMEFRSYNLENLQLIGIVLSYFYRYTYGYSNLIIPELGEEFNKDLEMCINLKRKYNMNSTIVIIRSLDLPIDFSKELYEYIRKYTRSLDTISIHNNKMIVLLNLTNVNQAMSYVDKIKNLINKDWTIDVEKNLDFKLVPVTTDVEKLRFLVGTNEQ